MIVGCHCYSSAQHYLRPLGFVWEFGREGMEMFCGVRNTWENNFEEPNLRSRKSKIKINNKPRSRSNHHQLQLRVNKKREKTQKKKETKKTATNNKKNLEPSQNRRDDAGDQNLQQLQLPRTQMKIRRTTGATTRQNGARREQPEPPPKEQAHRW